MSTVDQVVNFGKVTVSTGYDQNATTVVLATGHGAKLPNAANGSYNLVWWNATDYQDPADDPNVEIVRVTAGGGAAGDTLTVTRAQESTTATQKQNLNKIYKMLLGVTAKMISELSAADSTPRIVALTDAATIAIDADTTDIGTLSSLSQSSTFSNPTGTPVEGQRLELRITSASSQSISFGTAFRGSLDVALPTTTTGGGKTDYIGFKYDGGKWDCLATNFGF